METPIVTELVDSTTAHDWRKHKKKENRVEVECPQESGEEGYF